MQRPGNTNLETYNAIRALGRTVKVVDCDLADHASVRALFQKALDAMGGEIHVLVNCAGIQRRSPAVAFSEQDWDDVRVPLLHTTSVYIADRLLLIIISPRLPVHLLVARPAMPWVNDALVVLLISVAP